MHPTYFFNFNTHPFAWTLFFPVLAVVVLWTLYWKGMALWRAAKNNDTGWFIALLLINTLGILEIIYLYTVGKKRG